ncbi:hypothetical protein LTR94_011910 [Friedmanniomyces endolithicus]|nr:hypothetical protein LTR94_011910 [Friedmanniomyces endolithicus]
MASPPLVRDHTVGDQQAFWDEENDAVIYDDVTLRMDQIATLFRTEHRRCQRILYKELMLDASRFQHMSALRLQDRAHVQDFLAALCVLIHISSGQPIREPEFFSMMWRNTQRRRHITIRFSRVMIHTNYRKQQSQQGLYQDSVRFLPQPIGTLLLDSIVYVLPLRERFLRQSLPSGLLSPLLWEQGGKVWSDARLSSCPEAACVRARIPRLHVSNWRQITVAIVKTKFAGDTNCFDVDAVDPDGEEIEEDVRTMTEQRNHRTRTVTRAYVNTAPSSTTFANLYIRKGLRASQLWQAFWGSDMVFADHKRKAGRDVEPTLTKRIAKGIYKPRESWSSGPLFQELRRLYYQSPDMQWKSKEQERALATMMMWQEQIIAILPTGGGKSMLFMLPCTLPEAGVTILVVPLVALRGDLLRRVRELGIDHLEWTPEEQQDASLVFVSAEAASEPKFLQYAPHLEDNQRLDRIVVDECHLTITAADYRNSIAEFEERNHLCHPAIMRASTNRPNIFYTVQQCPSGQGSLLSQVATDVLESWLKLVSADQDKAVLYVRSRDEARDLAALLECDVYVGGDSLTSAEKSAFLQQWTSNPQRSFLVATTALAEASTIPWSV